MRLRYHGLRLRAHVTPAMAAGLNDHEWCIEELVALLEEREAAANH